MSNIVAALAGGKGQHRPGATPLPTHSDRLHELARRVERLGVAGRTDPETIVLGKLTIASELRELARTIRP
jgi:hypothetical protein